MSLAFESPTQVNNNKNEAYFTPLNMPNFNSMTPKEDNNTPYYTAPINPGIHQEFLNAIQSRHATQPIMLSTQNIITTTTTTTANNNINPFNLNMSSIANRRNLNNNKIQKSNQQLSSIEPFQLNKILNSNILILDVRSFVQYSNSNIKNSINVSIPNTILKRPSFTLDKIYDAIVLEQARERLKNWESFETIVFYDQQSTLLQENTASNYLANKLMMAGFKGKLYYLKGGFDAFLSGFKESCEISNHEKVVNLTGPQTLKRGLRLNHLATPVIGPFTAPMPQFENQAFNPFFSNIRQNMELSHGPIRERFPIRLPPQCNVDPNRNIIHSKIKLPRSPLVTQQNQSSFHSPTWLQNSLGDLGTQLLAETYEKIEKTEQRRLQNIMHFHSKHTDNPAEYPFSIVAGIEMGALNRYTNIWPYEYTRVKIRQPKSSDYINASYIQYIDSQEGFCDARPDKVNTESIQIMKENNSNQPYRRYISTQGPLPTTFNDFWQVVWEQNSYVLVMLTKEEEMNKIKCHRYWPSELNQPTIYGDIKITLLSEIKDQVETLEEQDNLNPDDVVITRILNVEYAGQIRKVTHLQYTGWMDFGVPDNPLGTLKVIQMANDAQNQYGKVGPMIVHCSAGCGRSGAFCTIDTVLHRITQLSSTLKDTDILLETISRFREQRLSMVQTLRQFVFCYEVIWWWLLGYGSNRIENMDTSV